MLTQFLYTVKRLLKEYRSTLVKLCSFILLILVLGSAFSGAFDVTSIDTVQVAYFVEDEGPDGKDFVEMMKQEPDVASLVKFTEVTERAEGERMLADEEVAAFLYIPPEFTQQVNDLSVNNDLYVYTKKQSSFDATVVQNIVDTFTYASNCAYAHYKLTGSVEDFSFDMQEGTKAVEYTASGNKPTSMGYYAVAMLLMMILYGADYGCSGMSEDYFSATGDRLRVSPLNPLPQFVGKLSALSLVTFLEAAFLVAFTGIVYDVDWGTGSTLLTLIVIVFVYSFFATAMGAVIGLVTKGKGEGMVMVAIIAFTFLAGGFVAMPMPIIENLSPSYYAKTAIFNLLYNGSQRLVWQSVGILAGLSAICTAVSTWLIRRKRV
ncbi:MAG: ABC transporter permease [Ruminococcaceae bacterium]|nr:ABC transporter permease [Oscillospiraceae bacterium]